MTTQTAEAELTAIRLKEIVQVAENILLSEDRGDNTADPEKVDKVTLKVAMPDEVENISKLHMKPLDLGKKPTPNLTAIFLIVLLLVSIGAFAYFFMKEFSLRKQSVLELASTKQTNVKLEQSVAELRSEVAKQRDEITRLMNDLKAAIAKAALADTLQANHKAELSRIKELYEGQLTSLRNVLQFRDDLINTFQSNLTAIRQILEKGGTPAAVIASSPGGAVGTNALLGRTSTVGKAPSGSVVLVDRDHQFIVISLGPADGAQVGRFVQIYQKGQPLGEGRIDRVYQNLSAVSILSEDVLQRVNKGDQIFLSLS